MEKPLQWHPAFQAVLQIEFAEEKRGMESGWKIRIREFFT